MCSPSGLRIIVVNRTTAEASWNPISTKDQFRGALLGYIVKLTVWTGYYSPYFLQTQKTATPSVVLTGLLDFLEYRLEVYGYSVDGSGSSTLQNFRTSKGQVNYQFRKIYLYNFVTCILCHI